MARQLINPKQTAEAQTYYDNNNIQYVFHKNNGYFFSDDKAMDSVVAHFKSMGFVDPNENAVKKPSVKKSAKKVSKK